MTPPDFKKLLEFSLINIDKPSGPTSFQVSQYVRKSLGLKKTAHLGTLDPKVSGVLTIALGRACRLSDLFMHKNKTYVGILRLHEDISLDSLKKEMSEFIGSISQLPPVRSRVKRAFRDRTIHEFKILEKDGKDVLFLAKVQAGTYIRKLCSDLGEKVGGAHMLELRRTEAGFFDEKKIYNLYEFDEALSLHKEGNSKKLLEMIIPAETAIMDASKVLQVKKSAITSLHQGKPLMSSDLKASQTVPEENFSIFSDKKFIGLYKPSKEGDILARPIFVYN